MTGANIFSFVSPDSTTRISSPLAAAAEALLLLGKNSEKTQIPVTADRPSAA
jgi:hypothetical protein